MSAKFATPEEKSEHYRQLARRSHEQRVVLGRDTVDCLLAELKDAYEVLSAVSDGPMRPTFHAVDQAIASIERAYQLVSDLKAARD